MTTPTEPIPVAPPRRPFRLWQLALALAGGILVGGLGTAIHRSIYFEVLPLGLIIGLLLTAAVALLARAAGGPVTLLAYAVGLVVTVQLLSLNAPGGSVLILDPRETSVRLPYLGFAWAIASSLILLLAFLLPPAWFQRSDQ